MHPEQEIALQMLTKAHAVLIPTETMSLISLQAAYASLDESLQKQIQDQVDCLQVAIDMMQSKEVSEEDFDFE